MKRKLLEKLKRFWFFHDRFSYDPNNKKTMYWLPPFYRIKTQLGISHIGCMTKYENSYAEDQYTMKFILKCPEIHPDTPEKLLERIKTIILFS